MYYGEIKFCDIANGPGVRTSLFVSGCTHHCQNCFNEMTWDFHYGQLYTKETEDKIVESLMPPYIKGLTILGGEPMEHVNQQGILPLILRVREQLPNKTIWVYTGYTYETDLLDRMCKEWDETMKILKNIDVLVDGEFVQDLKNLSLRFRGSSNQRIIDVQKSLETGTTVLSPEMESRI